VLENIRRCDRSVKGKRCGKTTPDNEPTKFMIDGVTYESDLCEEHIEELREVLKPFTSIANSSSKKVGKANRKTLSAPGGKAFTVKDVRKWLLEQGREVSSTGRISNSLMEEFLEAQRALPAREPVTRKRSSTTVNPEVKEAV
jgi:hypothetical protein